MISKGVQKNPKNGNKISQSTSNWIKTGIQEKCRWSIQGMSSVIGVHKTWRSVFQWELLTCGIWNKTVHHSTYIVDQQVLITSYIVQDCVFIRQLIRMNIHKDTTDNGRGTLKRIYIRWHAGSY